MIRSLLALATLLLVSACAGGGGCTVDKWAELPVRVYRNLPLVEARINRMPVVMVLDTGAQRTLITSAAAGRLGLTPAKGRAMVMRGIGGAMINWEAEPDSFSFANIAVKPMGVMVAPIRLPESGGVEPDGLLGADVLSALDVDLDMPHRTVSFYRARTCPAGPPWTEPYATIAVHRSNRNALLLPLSLDGHPLQAELDTGTSVSTINPKAALRSGLQPEALLFDPSVQVRGANPGIAMQRLHRFGEMGIGEESFPDPMLLISGSDLSEWDVLLGSDYLRRKRVWLSYATGRIFVSPPVGMRVAAAP